MKNLGMESLKPRESKSPAELKRVYFFPHDSEGTEAGKPVSVELKADGTADISKLPENLRSRLENFGVPDEAHQEMLLPKDGENFLRALVRSTNGYVRFRTSQEKS